MGHPFGITVNDRPLSTLDPFLEDHIRGQALHPESFFIEGHKVTVSPFVLPFPSRLREDELLRAGGRESLKIGHGFYVYRGGRLVVPGGWFRIVPADDLIRLARIRVDVPVALDHLWKVDIRKTVVEPPIAIRNQLRRIVGDVTSRSRRVYTHRGSPQHDPDRIPLWQKHDLRDGAATWRINREHPAVTAMTGSYPDLENLLRILDQSLPIHDIHLHVSNDRPVDDADRLADAELEDLARRMVEAFSDEPEQVSTILERLPMTEPFNRDPNQARRIAEKLRQ